MAPWPPTAQAPWSPTAHTFAHHQFSHVTNFWKQSRQASFQMEVLPVGKAELSLTFNFPQQLKKSRLPSLSNQLLKKSLPHLEFLLNVTYNPSFPKRCGAKLKTVSSRRRRKNYQRSVLHRAALAMSSLLPPKSGSLRQAAQACVQRLQAVSLKSSPPWHKG